MSELSRIRKLMIEALMGDGVGGSLESCHYRARISRTLVYAIANAWGIHYETSIERLPDSKKCILWFRLRRYTAREVEWRERVTAS